MISTKTTDRGTQRARGNQSESTEDFSVRSVDLKLSVTQTPNE